MLLGQYEGKVDSKNRTALPKKFREVLGEKIIITSGYEASLIIVSEQEWEQLLEGTKGRPFIEYETRETQRFLLGGASQLELDSKGRFVLPDYLRTFARIEDEVIFLGLSRYVEVWDKDKWEKYRLGLVKNIEGISARLVAKGEKEKSG